MRRRLPACDRTFADLVLDLKALVRDANRSEYLLTSTIDVPHERLYSPSVSGGPL
jgi:hypothetical protein